MTDTSALEDAVQAWVTAWCDRNPEDIMALWDSEDEDARYLPGEREQALTDAASVKDYVVSLCGLFHTIRHRPGQLIAKQVSEDVGLVFYVLDWAVADARGPIGGQCRVTAVWRKCEGQWKLTEYAEAPVAPLVELKEFYQHVAAEGLPA